MTLPRDIVTNHISQFVPQPDATEFEGLVFETCQEYGIDYVNYSYEIIGVLRTIKLPDCAALKRDISLVRENFALSFFDLFRQSKLDRIRIDNLKPDYIEGIYTCKKCKGDKFWTWTAQTRSGDEGATVYAQCFSCPPEIGRFRL
jgi:hypothetical protein